MPFLLAIASGVLGFLAYPSLSWWPLIFVCYVPLLVALEGQSGRVRFRLGWVTGVALISVKHYFIGPTFVYFSNLPWALAGVMFVTYVAYTALGWGLFAWGAGRLRSAVGRWAWVLIVPVWYAVIERWFPFLFPFYVSSALYQVPVLLQTSEWIGSTGVTVLVMGVSCALADGWKRRESGAKVLLGPGLALALWCLLWAWGAHRMQQLAEAPLKATLVATMVQPNTTIEEKKDWSIAHRDMLWRRVSGMTREAAADDPDVILWPEGGFPFVYRTEAVQQPRQSQENMHLRYSRALLSLAESLSMDFMPGGLRVFEGRSRNSAFYFAPGSREPVVYDKQLLLWFGERIPFAETFPALTDWIPGTTNHKAGEHFVHYDAAGVRWAPNICYEALFPAFTRQGLNEGEGADILLNLTNDVWFGSAQEAEHHLMVQTQRAIENRVWLVRTTNSGISAFVDPAGNTRARAEVGERRLLTQTLEVPDIPWSFYRRYGDVWVYVAIAASLLWIGWVRRRTSAPAGDKVEGIVS